MTSLTRNSLIFAYTRSFLLARRKQLSTLPLVLFRIRLPLPPRLAALGGELKIIKNFP
jgi:hypothetical protein